MKPAIIVRPFQITRRHLEAMFSSPTLVRRMIDANWIEVVRRGRPGCEAFYDFASAERAYARLRDGEDPDDAPKGGVHV